MKKVEVKNPAFLKIAKAGDKFVLTCDVEPVTRSSGVKIYHLPRDFNYSQIAIDQVKGE